MWVLQFDFNGIKCPLKLFSSEPQEVYSREIGYENLQQCVSSNVCWPRKYQNKIIKNILKTERNIRFLPYQKYVNNQLICQNDHLISAKIRDIKLNVG